MKADLLRKKFLGFFKQRGHTVVPSSSIIPDDPSVLLTTAGMQQFKKYYTGEADPLRDFGSKNTTSIQKSFRTSDIDEVGDESHLTFFEMMGNFSFGEYFKKEAICYAYDFFQEIKLPIEYVTVFGGDSEVLPDEESEKIWRKLLAGSDPARRIERRGREDNFWGPTGGEGPCGPTTEIYVNGIEIWNIVFNQYYCKLDKSLVPLEKPGVDTGMGLERLAVVMQKKHNIFETDLFRPLLKLLPKGVSERHERIIADHLRGSVFLLADGVRPSNKEAGYILRRLMRRALVYESQYRFSPEMFDTCIDVVVKEYGDFYPELQREHDAIHQEFAAEREKFSKTLARGMKELAKLERVTGETAFWLYETFGLPYEIIKEVGGEQTRELTRDAFDKEFQKHQEKSRAGQEKKFGGHGLLLDTGELKAKDEEELKKVTRLHTATHLMQAALRRVLGDDVHQQGSDITVERTRFDFTFPRKLTKEELQKVEDLVNDAAQKDLMMEYKEMPFEEAVKTGALYFTKEKYPARVKVYTAYDPKTNEIFSSELCGGPHVTRTGEVGQFKILKEESSSAGVRRIRAVVE